MKQPTAPNGSIQKYKYLMIISSDELVNRVEYLKNIQFFLDQYRENSQYYIMCLVNNTRVKSIPGLDMVGDESEVAASDSSIIPTCQSPTTDFTILLWYNKDLQGLTCYEKLKYLVNTFEFSLKA